MVTAPTADELYASAAKFAQSALEAHHKGEHQRVAIDAATALEHLTKGCLANRSPVLLTEFRSGPNNWQSLLWLCGFAEGRPNPLRTVGLREARERAKSFVKSLAPEADLALLIDLRDGVVHTALNEEVEERLLVAFVQQADAILADMGRPRDQFWREQLDVVDALLADASDRVAYGVAVKLAAAKAAFAQKYGELSDELLELIQRISERHNKDEEAIADCPACESVGVAEGEYWVDGDVEVDHRGEPQAWSVVKINAEKFTCVQCGLRLTTPAELAAAGMAQVWDLPDLLPSDFIPDDYWRPDYD